jgi:hypothetical protein
MRPPLIPPRPFFDVLVGRVVVLWVALHTVVAMQPTDTEGSALVLPPITVVALAAVIVVAIRIALRRRGEGLFLANLGYSFLHVGAVVLALVLALEALLGVAVRVVS